MLKKLTIFCVMFLLLFSIIGLAACNNGDELADYKTQAIESLEAYAKSKGQDNYTAENWETIKTIVENGKTTINTAESKEAVDTAKAEAMTAIMTIDEVTKKEKDVMYTLLESSNCCPPFEQSSSYWDNIAPSAVAYEEAIIYFTTATGEYTDDFGGVFVDENGLHNICVVGNRKPVISDYLIYKQVENSFNFLKSIFVGLESESQQFSVWQVSVCEVCNGVIICLESESKIPLLIEYLKTNSLFKKGTLNIFVGENQIVPN
ncbi:MAG: hypothetical protein WC292_03845 [Clostridia bacterium]